MCVCVCVCVSEFRTNTYHVLLGFVRSILQSVLLKYKTVADTECEPFFAKGHLHVCSFECPGFERCSGVLLNNINNAWGS